MANGGLHACRELGVELPPYRESLHDLVWRWVLVQSSTDNTLKRIESNEDDDTKMYASLAQIAPSDINRVAIQAVPTATKRSITARCIKLAAPRRMTLRPSWI